MNKQRRGDYGNAPNTIPSVGLNSKAKGRTPSKSGKGKKTPAKKY